MFYSLDLDGVRAEISRVILKLISGNQANVRIDQIF
jgi:hypothetical protein